MSSALIKIPDEALSDLKRIVDIDDKAFDSLVSVIKETEPTLRSGDLVGRIAKRVSLPADILKAVLGTSFVLFNLKKRIHIESPELAESIANSSSLSESGDFKPENRSRLQKRLSQLLSFEKPLGVTSKAVDIMTEHEKIFCSARIMSDIRPVFSEKADEASAAVIIHNLQIGYHQDGEHREFYVALDTDDIQTMKDLIQRAEKKTSALEAILNKANVSYLEA